MPRLSKKEVYKNVKEACSSIGSWRQVDMAKICGIEQSSVSKWCRGINYPTLENVLDISDATDYEVQWIFSRKGPQLIPSEQADLAPQLMVQLIDALRSDDVISETARLYSIAPIGLGYLDTDLRYGYINQWLAALNGMTPEQHMGKTIYDILPKIAEKVADIMLEVIETGEPVVDGLVEAETLSMPGVKQQFRHNYFPDYGDKGQIVGIHIVVHSLGPIQEDLPFVTQK